MRAFLVRVGIDQSFGGWNAPVDPDTREFVYVPIPDGECRPELATGYATLTPALTEFAAARVTEPGACVLPADLVARNMHLDPDFRCLTYGDQGDRRGKGIAACTREDVVVFYAGLRPCRGGGGRPGRLVYAIIGLYRVEDVVRLAEVEATRWHENAHTRRRAHDPRDVIVRALPDRSGRLRRCISIGDWRNKAYRVRPDLLARWGDLSCKDGFLQRSGVPPTFLEPERFLDWFAAQDPELVRENNTAASVPVVVVHLRQPGAKDRRTDPLYEFGSFGLTTCHDTNLLADRSAAGCRLAFAQGGDRGFRLVMLTPPVDVRELAHVREAFWRPAEFPLRYDVAPVLIDNDGSSDVAGMRELLAGVNRNTWREKFSSAFRSRKQPLPADVATSVVQAWTRATQGDATRASHYWEALPRWDLDVVDRDRHATYRTLLAKARGEPGPKHDEGEITGASRSSAEAPVATRRCR